MMQSITPSEKTWLALVVDDHVYMRSLIRTMLHQIGIKQVEEFENAEICLRRISMTGATVPDLIVLDWHMQGMDGYEFCNTVRLNKNLREKHIPIIMVTGEKDPMLLEQATDMGVKAVLNKPVSLPKFKEAIRIAMGAQAPFSKQRP
ncbi:MAG: response regulator [Alphaproteobacteria bacterium]|nr:response regulator [Alphaproteobacteria bacterium]